MIGLIKLMRIPNDFTIGFAVIVGEYIGFLGYPSLKTLLLGFISGFFISASIMVINDILDIEVDRINAPYRPLPSGIIDVKTASLFSSMLFVIGIVTSYLLSILNFIIAFLFWILGVVYNWKLKRRGLIGNSIVSLSVAIPFLYGSIAVGRLNNLLIILFSSMAFLTNMGREVIKGILDLKGDREKGINTIAVKYGSFSAYKLSIFFILVAISISILPPFLDLVNIYFYSPLVFLTDFLLLFSLYLGQKLDDNSLFRAKKLILYSMLTGLLAFIVGVIHL